MGLARWVERRITWQKIVKSLLENLLLLMKIHLLHGAGGVGVGRGQGGQAGQGQRPGRYQGRRGGGGL